VHIRAFHIAHTALARYTAVEKNNTFPYYLL
jgi:hypothetical protein